MTIPASSPAGKVAMFADKPVGQWFTDGWAWHYVDTDGAYATVWPDDEPTGHWFIDVEYADGRHGDDFRDAPGLARKVAEDMLFGLSSTY